MCSESILFYRSGNGTGDSFKESWPATTSVELCGGFIKRSIASYTTVNSFLVEVDIFPCSWISEINKTQTRKNKGELYTHPVILYSI